MSSELLDAQSLMAEFLSRTEPDKAPAYYRELIDRSTRIRGEEHPETLLLMSNLGTHFRAYGRHADAIPLLRRVYEAQSRTLGEAHRQTLISLNHLARSMAKNGETEDALAMVENGIERSNSAHGEISPTTAFLMYARARVLMRGQDAAATENALRRAAEVNEQALGADAPGTWFSHVDLLNFYSKQQRHDEALDQGNRLLALVANKEEGGQRLAETYYHVGRAFMRARDFGEAETHLLKSEKSNTNPLWTSAIRKSLAELYDAWGRPEDAAPWRQDNLAASP